MSTADPGRYVLSGPENERLFRTRIVPQRLSGAAAQHHPVLVIVGSQTGAGKTAVTGMIKDSLARRGGAVHINMDFFNPYHPLYDSVRSTDPVHADAFLRPDGDRWWHLAQEHAIEQRADVLLESAMQTEAEFEDIARKFAEAGYRIEVALVAVPAALSQQGILARYLEEVRDSGQGRLVDRAIHDRCYDGVLRGAQAADRGAAQAVSVFRRGNVAVHVNQQGAGGDWRRPPAAARAVTAERSRQLTASEASTFRRTQARLTRELGPELQDELAAIKAMAAPLLGPAPHWPQRPYGALSDTTLSHQADAAQRSEQQLENARLVTWHHAETLSAAPARGQGPEVLGVEQTFRRLLEEPLKDGEQARTDADEEHARAIHLAQVHDDDAAAAARRQAGKAAGQHEQQSRRLDLLQAEQQLRSDLPADQREAENIQRVISHHPGQARPQATRLPPRAGLAAELTSHPHLPAGQQRPSGPAQRAGGRTRHADQPRARPPGRAPRAEPEREAGE